MTNDELLHKWINNTISEKELKVFKQRPEYDSLVKLYKRTENFAAPAIDTEEMLQSILQSDKNQTAPQTKSKSRALWPSIAIAASVILIATYFLFNNAHLTTFENSSNQELAKNLPSGSKVTLYAESQIEFDEGNWKQTRKLELKGKAFFDVVSGNSFVVNSAKGTVEVLGTQFMIDNKEESYEVICSEGKVKVSSNLSGANAILQKNESFLIFDAGGSILRQEKLTKVKAINLERVITEMESIFDRKINSTNVDLQQMISTGFENDNLENAIKSIGMALNLNYEKQGETFTLKNK